MNIIAITMFRWDSDFLNVPYIKCSPYIHIVKAEAVAYSTQYCVVLTFVTATVIRMPVQLHNFLREVTALRLSYTTILSIINSNFP